MNKTVLFLIVLVTPLVFAQHDVLNLLDKTPEGKEMLDNLLIQTKLMGDNLDTVAVNNFLKTNRDRIESEAKASQAWLEGREAECKADRKALADLVANHQDRHLTLKRHLESANRSRSRVSNFSERSREESDNYAKFQNYITENKNSWNKYFETVSTNFKSVQDILKQVLVAGEATPTVSSGTAFAQLSQEYHLSLAEIKMKVDTASVEYTGMGPILSNLVEIMADPKAVNNPEVMKSIKTLTKSLQDSVRNRLDEIEQENETQKSLFEHLENAFKENVERSKGEVERLTAALKSVDKRITALTSANEHARTLYEQVQNILELRGQECSNYHSNKSDAVIRTEKLNTIINQVEDLLINNKLNLKTFFIQREIRSN